MKTSTAKKIEVHARKSNAKLADAIKRIHNDRQPDMTELMLNDIDSFKDSEKQTGANGCTFRLTKGGEYFTTGKGSSRTIQLSMSAKKRLTQLTGGTVRMINKKETLVNGAFSDQDFRRCFDYIKSCGKWVVETDEDGNKFEEFVIDTTAVNNAMRNGARWDSLHLRTTTRQTTRQNSKAISINHYEEKPSLKDDGTFADKRKAKKYYQSLMVHLITQCRKGGLELSAQLDGNAILTEV